MLEAIQFLHSMDVIHSDIKTGKRLRFVFVYILLCMCVRMGACERVSVYMYVCV